MAASGQRSSEGKAAGTSRQLEAKTSAIPELRGGADQPSSLADKGLTADVGRLDFASGLSVTMADFGLTRGSMDWELA